MIKFPNIPQNVNSIEFDSLAEAVHFVVKEFVRLGRKFSAYEVTSEIRDQINSKFFILKGVDFEEIKGTSTQIVGHIDVREEVRELVNDGYLTRVFVGSYYKYFAANQETSEASYEISSPEPAKSSSVTPTKKRETLTVGLQGSHSTSANQKPEVTDAEVKAFIRRHIGKGGKALTLKRIQSAFPRKRISVDKISSIVNKMGLLTRNRGFRKSEAEVV